ncbi:MAG: Holliday junction resolvase RuvX [Sandaracinaceae bacterium]
MRRLGVDHGTRRIGLAVSDEEGWIASPHRTLAHVPGASEDAVREVAEEARALGVGEIVVGLPLTLEGREAASARRARAFAERVEAAAGVPVVLWDERLTTAQAERAMREAGVRARDQRKRIDQAAAAVLLQSYIDAQRAKEATRWPDDNAPRADPGEPAADVDGGERGRGGPSPAR